MNVITRNAPLSKHPRARLYLIIIGSFMVAFSSALSSASPLATDDQIELERLALRVAAAPLLRQARERVRALLLADSSAQTSDGAAGLDRALDQWVMGQVVATINNDPSRPKLMWAVDNTPRKWFGHVFPGGAVAIDNPDNVNRTGPLDGAWSYELQGRFGSPPTAQMSININLAEGGQLRWGDAVATMTNLQVVADDDGRFSITLDKSPADGRQNHMQLADGPLQISIRDSHSDWRQLPTAFTIKVTSGPSPAEPATEQELIQHSADGLEEFVKFWLGFKNTFWNTPDYNEIVGPNAREREGGWGTQAGGRYLLEDDQALVVVTTDGGAAYTGFQISDPWTISPTPIYQTTSRNLTQSSPNADSSYTYVISLVDPGVANWIDTAGLHEGWFMLRWQNLPPNAEIAPLVREIKLINLRDLDKALPQGTPRTNLQQRREEILARMAQHRIRSTVD